MKESLISYISKATGSIIQDNLDYLSYEDIYGHCTQYHQYSEGNERFRI
jgi:hypothetical protein